MSSRPGSLRCIALFLGFASACGGGDDSEPVRVEGGGLAGEPLGGTLHVFVVDGADGDVAVEGASVRVGAATAPIAEGVTDGDGLVTLSAAGLSGPVSVSAEMDGHVPTTWVGVDRSSLTISLARSGGAPFATLSGSIEGFEDAAPELGHRRLAVVDATHAAEDIPFVAPAAVPAVDGAPHVCVRGESPSPCSFTLQAVAGTRTVFATIVDVDEGPTDSPDDDTREVIGFVHSAPIEIDEGASVGGVRLDQSIDAVGLSVELPGLPPGLTSVVGIPGVRGGSGEQVMLVPLGATPADATAWVPSLDGELAGGSYWVIGRAASADGLLVSTRIGRGFTDAAQPVALDAWAPPPEVTIESDALAIAGTPGAAYHDVRLSASGAVTWQVVVVGRSDRVAFDLAPAGSVTSGAVATVTAIITPMEPEGLRLERAHAALVATAAASLPVP